MKIRTLRLRNFRNYENAQISLDPGLNFLTGANAQGKTNLLESLVVLSLTRSFRLSNDAELIRRGADHAEIGCIFEDRIDRRIDVIIHSAGKTLLVEKQPVRKSSAFIGLLNVVLFSPDDLGIFTDAPRARRQILNQEITKISPGYLNALNSCQGLLKERNALLKQFQPDIRMLDVLDQQMIQSSVPVIKARRAFVRGIGRHMEEQYSQLSGREEKASVSYLSCIDSSREDIETAVREKIQGSRQKDLEMHVTGTGIHREDLCFELDGRNLIYEGSQGQKRMEMLAFKTSLLKFIEETTGKKAVLLLDDVFSELDRVRQQRLLDMISGTYQCVITATEIPSGLKPGPHSEFEIRAGGIYPRTGGRNE